MMETNVHVLVCSPETTLESRIENFLDGTEFDATVTTRTEPLSRSDAVEVLAGGHASETNGLASDGTPDEDGDSDTEDVDCVVYDHDPETWDVTEVVDQVHAQDAIVVALDRTGEDADTIYDAGVDEYVQFATQRPDAVLGHRIETAMQVAASLQVDRRNAERIGALNAVTSDLLDAETPMEVASTASDAAGGGVLGFPGTSFRLYQEDDHSLHKISGSKIADIEDRPPYPVDDSPHGTAWQQQETVVDIIDQDDDPYDREIFTECMYVPVGEYGTISTGITEGSFSELDRAVTELLAQNTRVAFEIANRDVQIQKTINSLTDVVEEASKSTSRLVEQSETVSDANDDIAAQMETIADNAGRQREYFNSVLSELSSLLETVSDTERFVNTMAERADASSELLQATRGHGDDSRAEIEQLEAQTEVVVDSVDSIEAGMSELAEIVEIIDDISEQINMLALNASIEAARADAGGEGFAVVADEIKSLSNETKDATGEIEQLVDSITARTTEATDGVSEMQQQVDEAIDTVESALAGLDEIAGEFEEVNDEIRDIDDRIGTQRRTIDQITETTEESASLSEDTAGSTQQVSASAQASSESLDEVTASARTIEDLILEVESTATELTERFEQTAR
jgi:methyl-accepting chemotaxis protein